MPDSLWKNLTEEYDLLGVRIRVMEHQFGALCWRLEKTQVKLREIMCWKE